MGQLILSGGGSGVAPVDAPTNSLPAGIVNPDARENHIFFEDFNDIASTNIATDSKFLEKYNFIAGTGALASNTAAASVDGRSILTFDISGTGQFTVNPRWRVDFNQVSTLNFEKSILFLDPTNTSFIFGFAIVNQPSEINIETVGYGLKMGLASTDLNVVSFSSQSGSSPFTIVAGVYHTLRATVNITAGVVQSVDMFVEDVLIDSITATSALTATTIIPVCSFRGTTAGDDIFLDYDKVFATV